MKIFKQALKFGVVGAGNTLLTLVIIWIMTKTAGCSDLVSNFTGYAIGIVSSYIFNKQWTFKSAVGWRKSAIRFFLVCGICWVIQWIVVRSLNYYCPENPPLYAFFTPILQIFKIDASFYIHMFAMIFYTMLNFVINKFYTFKA